MCLFWRCTYIILQTQTKHEQKKKKGKIKELFIGLGSQTLPRELRPFVQFFVLASWGASVSFSQPAPLHIPQCSHDDCFFKCILCTALHRAYRHNKFDGNLQKQLKELP